MSFIAVNNHTGKIEIDSGKIDEMIQVEKHTSIRGMGGGKTTRYQGNTNVGEI